VELLVVQHGDKVRAPGDPGLTELGHRQAAAAATHLRGRGDVARIWCSPLRRARETAAPIEAALALDATIDERLRERMNWEGEDGDAGQTLAAFLAEWARASADRTFVPRSGDSSAAAGDRFVGWLGEVTDRLPSDATIVAVAHGGVTVDGLRSLLGDDTVHAAAPGAIAEGVPAGAITTVRQVGGAWHLDRFGDQEHLAAL
jgi:broad specificity phosphatase PhoE